MKFLVVLFLVGFASASHRDVLDDAADEVLRDYVNAMELNPSLKNYLALAEGDDETEDEIKTDLAEKLREKLDQVLEKIKVAIEQGKAVKDDLKDKVKEIKEKLKDIKADIGERARELLEKIKEKAKDYLQKLLERLGLKEKKEVEVRSLESLKEFLMKLKKAILESFDGEKVIEVVEEYYGKGSDFATYLFDLLKDKSVNGKQMILNFINMFLGESETEKRSISELFEKLRDFFKNFNIELKEKFLKFGEWVKEKASKGLDNAKTKAENLKQIASELVDRSKEISKEVAVEGLEFLRPYKDMLGDQWEKVKETVKNVLQRKD